MLKEIGISPIFVIKQSLKIEQIGRLKHKHHLTNFVVKANNGLFCVFCTRSWVLDFGRNEAQPSVNEEITLKTSNYMPFRKFAKAFANAVASWRKMT